MAARLTPSALRRTGIAMARETDEKPDLVYGRKVSLAMSP